MSIRKKLFLLLSGMIMSLMILGTYSIIQQNSNQKDNAELNSDLTIETELNRIKYRITGLSNDERAYLLTGDTGLPEQMKEKTNDIKQSISSLKELVRTSQEKEGILNIEKGFDEFSRISQQVIEMQPTNSEEALSLHMGPERDARKNVLEPAVDTYIERLNKETTINKQRIKSDAEKFTAVLILLTVVISITATVFGLLLILSIIKPLKELNKQMKDISDGEADLTRTIHIKNKDELGELALSFNKFTGQLRGMIKGFSEMAEQVAASSEQMTASAEQTIMTSEQVTMAMQEVSAGSITNYKRTDECSNYAIESKRDMDFISRSTYEVSEITEKTLNQTVIGSKSVQRIVENMTIIDSSVGHAIKSISTLENRSNQINDILLIITNIAEQTNLLALNAAIEAARAGEHGKGFSIVADEVRKLAEQSHQSASSVKELILKVQEDMRETVNIIQTVKGNVDKGISQTDETSVQFDGILGHVNQITLKVQDVAQITSQVTNRFSFLNQSMDEITQASRLVTERTEEVAAATEEQLASMQEINASASSLTQMAEQLMVILSRFKY